MLSGMDVNLLRERERDGGEGLKGRRKESKGRIECA
jgi:hypothetical protein